MTFVAIWLIDRLGRRPLLSFGVAGMAISLLVISQALSPGLEPRPAASAAPVHERVVLIAIISYVACFAISLGPVMWVLLSEIFPSEQMSDAHFSGEAFWNSSGQRHAHADHFPAELATFGSEWNLLGLRTAWRSLDLCSLAALAPESGAAKRFGGIGSGCLATAIAHVREVH